MQYREAYGPPTARVLYIYPQSILSLVQQMVFIQITVLPTKQALKKYLFTEWLEFKIFNLDHFSFSKQFLSIHGKYLDLHEYLN